MKKTCGVPLITIAQTLVASSQRRKKRHYVASCFALFLLVFAEVVAPVLTFVAAPNEALADTPFTNFAFPVPGSSTNRTMPNRLVDIYNVKDFGAVGSGSGDDTTAIQNTINAASTAGSTSQGASKGAIVFLPSGVYPTSAPLTFSGNNTIHLIGSGRHSTALVGSFTGYIIDKPDDGTQSLEVVKSLYIKNNRQNADAGGLRMNAAEKGLIEDCFIQGFTGIEAVSNVYGLQIRNCDVACAFSSNPSGSVGIYMTQVGCYGTRVTGYDVGWQLSNVGSVISGSCSCETTNTAIVVGRDRSNMVSTANGFVIEGFQTERVNIGLDLVSGSAGVIAGNIWTGTVGPDGSTPPQYGIRVRDATNVSFIANTVSALASVGGIDLNYGGNTSGSGTTFISTLAGAGGWLDPPSNQKSAFQFVSCQHFLILAFTELPGQAGSQYMLTAVEGMEYNINNSNTATWGATAAGGGSNHVSVRYNGTNWTVVGK